MIKKLVFAGLVLWFVFGAPFKTIANAFWAEEQAPWEKVDAFYYPNANNLARDSRALGLRSVDECRLWVRQQAQAQGDPGLKRGSYECGIGYIEDYGDLRVYRTSVR